MFLRECCTCDNYKAIDSPAINSQVCPMRSSLGPMFLSKMAVIYKGLGEVFDG